MKKSEWREKKCRRCFATIRYNVNRKNIPDYCPHCMIPFDNKKENQDVVIQVEGINADEVQKVALALMGQMSTGIVSAAKKILVIFANPNDSARLRLDEEDRAIRECLKRSKNRDTFHLEIRHAVRISDIRRLLLENEYQIIHFSGHGINSGELILEDDNGQARLVSQEALANFLRGFSFIECVLLNACYSLEQGRLLALGIPYTIAMQAPISDVAARRFTEGFYDAIGAGCTYQRAYEIGRAAISLDNQSDENSPVLIMKE